MSIQNRKDDELRDQAKDPWNAPASRSQQSYPPYYGPGSYPHGPDRFHYHHHGPGLHGLSIEEIKAIQECRSDATWKYALPGAVIAALSTGLAIKQGYLSSNRAILKTVFAAFFGNIAGRGIYIKFGDCQNRLAKLNTPIGETARKLNEAGVKLPPYMIVAGAEPDMWNFGPWASWRNQDGRGSGFGSGYRYNPGFPPAGSQAPENAGAGDWQSQKGSQK